MTIIFSYEVVSRLARMGYCLPFFDTNVKAYDRYLCRFISEGKAKPSFLVSHTLPLDKGPDAYQHFDARENGWTKVVLTPAA